MLKFLLAAPILISIIIIVISLSNFGENHSSLQNIPVPSNPPSSSPQTQNQPQIQIPTSHIIPQKHHTFQTFNNCGPAALSMLLSYHGINISQHELGQKLRPYQNPQGDNDDKSVTLEELAKEAENQGLIAFHRPNGDENKLKKFIANDIPVVTRTFLVLEDDIGHYRVVRGYDDQSQEFIQDDSLQYSNSRYTYTQYLALWKPYNYEYLAIVPKDKEETAKQILGEELDPQIAWHNAHANLQSQLSQNPNDTFAQFNLANTLYHLGRYQEAVEAYEKIENKLSFRTLWYQIEPILAYNALNDYGKVFQITDRVLQNHNRAFSELYVIRGDIYKQQGNLEAAKSEYEKAVFFNKNLKEAQQKLSLLGV